MLTILPLRQNLQRRMCRKELTHFAGSTNMGYQVSLIHQPASQQQELRTPTPFLLHVETGGIVQAKYNVARALAPWHYIFMQFSLNLSPADCSVLSSQTLTENEQPPRIPGGLLLDHLLARSFEPLRTRHRWQVRRIPRLIFSFVVASCLTHLL